MTEIHKIIAAINPKLYCKKELVKKVKRTAKKDGFLKAAESADVREAEPFLFDLNVAKENPFLKVGLKFPKEEHKITYDTLSSTLESTYFWILDMLGKEFKTTEKITDNFTSTAGSPHFSEFGQKATMMQKEAGNALGAVNQVTKSILNIIYDLKEFKIRLSLYDDLNSKDKKTKESALLSLKQAWMDTVDMKRGQGSINALTSGNLQFVTLRDSFMAVNSLSDVGKLDLNDRVKRLLKQRVGEFEKWLKESGTELRKRFNIEKHYLRSQVNTLKIYSRWVKPYLNVARQLEQSAESKPDLVTAFSSTVMELTLLGKSKYDSEGDVIEGRLPRTFLKKRKREYSSVIVVEFKFRGIPQRTQAGSYTYLGKTEIKLTSYALNDDEWNILKRELDKDDVNEMIKLIEEATTESLGELQKDIDDFLDEKKEAKKTEKPEDTNPFSALFSFLKAPPKKEEQEQKTTDSNFIKPDNPYEKILRSQAIMKAREKCASIFNKYKKAHEMPAV